ncbi:hypothetical protein [Paludisphaera soli]|uniref:hypothetical protein n=1 Tax=Paludisphaera soli TaxID=2712865 RepID=UPI0013ECFEAC|nr:hypothetical protein [Paludisphaera soli]
MRRRTLGPAILLTACATLATGCDTLRPSSRKRAEAAEPVEARSVDQPEAVDFSGSKVPGIDSTAKNPTPFFKNSRLSGGLSEEARDIERSLGVK